MWIKPEEFRDKKRGKQNAAVNSLTTESTLLDTSIQTLYEESSVKSYVSISSLTSEQSTTFPEETFVNTNGTSPYCDDMSLRNLQMDCVPIIENVKEMVDSVLRGNLSNTEMEVMIDHALLKLQDISINKEQTPEDLDSSIDMLDKILNVSQTSNVSLPRTVIMTTIDNLLEVNHTAAWNNTSTKEASARVNKIFKTVDKFGMYVLKTIENKKSITFNSTNNIGTEY
ncbi:uncharacterized protein LOC133185138 [Saccostrea echinata]|uniref:uncharacterized protein LOC133185138 n=1 Tax=Saccostrea echinata TaxID=191078 RepID=UPI002A7F674D|nr:uncharacterized protein LOC133185138 [Saccostrea echinata]